MKKTVCLLLLLLLLTGCRAAVLEETITLPPETTLPPESAGETLTEPGETSSGTPALSAGLHSGLDSEGIFTEGTVFLGDSLTHGFVLYYLQPAGVLGDAGYMAISGAPLSYFWNPNQTMGSAAADLFGHIYSPEFSGMTMEQGMLQMGEDAKAIYVMLGTNGSAYTTVQEYIDLADYLLVTCPNATVYLQTIPPAAFEGVDAERANEIIRGAAEHFAVGGERRLILLDTHSAFALDSLRSDGIHLNETGNGQWYDFIRQYAENHGIAE